MKLVGKDDPILVIIGPSGTGKSTIIQALSREGLIEVTPTWTTRPARPKEPEQAVEHRFVTDATFDRHLANGEFIETVQMFGLPYRYGLPWLALPDAHKVPVIMLRAPLIPRLSQYYSSYRIYQIEDSLPRIKARLEERNQDGEAMGSRLDDFEKEIAAGRQLADRVFTNSDLPTVTAEVREAILRDFK